MDEKQTACQPRPKSRFKINKQIAISFLAGMVAALILVAGIGTAINPAFLTGTMTNTAPAIRYRIFPEGARLSALYWADKFAGEITILYADKEKWRAWEPYVLCDGGSLKIDDWSPLLWSLYSAYNPETKIFTLPDYTGTELSEGMSYYISSLPNIQADTSSATKIADGLAYIEENYPNSWEDVKDDLLCGEITLFKTSNPDSLSSVYLPCRGQTLKADDYPGLAYLIAPDKKEFTLPDLRGKSPIDGAEFYIVHNGALYYTPVE